MRISELSRRSGVPVATIKYYLREDLLPKGAAVSTTQADYSEAHLQRLRLVRALVEVAEVPLARIRAVLAAVDNPDLDLHTVLGTAIFAMSATPESHPGDPAWDRAAEQTDALLAELDWRVTPDSPARVQLTRALAAMQALGRPATPEMLRGYASAAHQAAELDVACIDPEAPREEALLHAISLSALMEQSLSALRRLAQEDVSAARFGAAPARTGKGPGAR
ncbi:MerR family transcriptional regulator [Streptomonospora nanhaiensis]|uniref:DNA-binding transcriptional MerR regulator n=1 Tax=Streptomonospora nanhaiensis TaxID=1323731 RepID=A0A853BM46_9ACTN|nr:MerR family transcriptional regulator [Streptomonospora nanhaiensis]MBX9391302.1 MerR family transcriptional regulator [Streptomonospora nanhaiensis]NYI95747.1 DNA-binding transcriptional MerR regulator [Streptomonospora nanhaiensis]